MKAKFCMSCGAKLFEYGVDKYGYPMGIKCIGGRFEKADGTPCFNVIGCRVCEGMWYDMSSFNLTYVMTKVDNIERAINLKKFKGEQDGEVVVKVNTGKNTKPVGRPRKSC